MEIKGTLKAGGICLIVMAVLNVLLDIIMAIGYDFPMRVQGALQKNLPYVLAHHSHLTLFLTYKAVLPLLLIPGAIGAKYMLGERCRGIGLNAMVFAVVAALTWCMSNMIWPSINWYAAQALQHVGYTDMLSYLLVGGLNSFAAIYLGLYLKVLCLSLWIFLLGLAGIRSKMIPNWLCYFGIVLAIIVWIMLFLRTFLVNPYVLDLGFNLFPIVNLWIFLLGCFMLLPPKDRESH